MTSAIRFYQVRVAFSFAHLISLLAGSGWIVASLVVGHSETMPMPCCYLFTRSSLRFT